MLSTEIAKFGSTEHEPTADDDAPGEVLLVAGSGVEEIAPRVVDDWECVLAGGFTGVASDGSEVLFEESFELWVGLFPSHVDVVLPGPTEVTLRILIASG